MSEHSLDVRPTVESLTQFLKEDDVVAQSLQVAATAAGVARASDDLLIVEEEDVARLLHLGLDSLSKLRGACKQLELVVARLLTQWREDSDSAFTPQEWLWALTYVCSAEGGEPAEQIRSLVAAERWWQRATDSHRSRFLDRIVTEIAVATDPKPEETG